MKTIGRAAEIFNRLESDGRAALDAFFAERKAEELFLDFKRSADNGDGERLHETDRKNLARALSGFANSEGGVIVWGVDASKAADRADVARTLVPIRNVARYVSWLEQAVSGSVVPPAPGVRSIIVFEDTDHNGVAATLIPQSPRAPHQTATHSENRRYYIRAGSSFEPAPHGLLAALFGHRPLPDIEISTTVGTAFPSSMLELTIELDLCNYGPGLVSDIYFNLQPVILPGERCAYASSPDDGDLWVVRKSRDGKHLVTREGFRLAPGARIPIMRPRITLLPPFTNRLQIRGNGGAAGCEPVDFELSCTAVSVLHVYDVFHSFAGAPPEAVRDAQIERLLGR